MCVFCRLTVGCRKGCILGAHVHLFGKYLICIAFFLLHTKTGTSTTKNAEWTKEKKPTAHYGTLCECDRLCLNVFVYYVVRYNSIDSLIWIDSLQLIHVSFDTITSEMASTLKTLTRNCFASSISELFASNGKNEKKRKNCPFWKCKSQESGIFHSNRNALLLPREKLTLCST